MIFKIRSESTLLIVLFFRSPHILGGVGQYLVDQHLRLEPAQVCAISQTFGTLDFHPPNGFKFWEVMENYLEHKFVKFSPLDMINMLVSFVYIERYPLNFTNKLFNPYFLDRLHAQPEEVQFSLKHNSLSVSVTSIFLSFQLIALSRAELKLFDSAMNLSCRSNSIFATQKCTRCLHRSLTTSLWTGVTKGLSCQRIQITNRSAR